MLSEMTTHDPVTVMALVRAALWADSIKRAFAWIRTALYTFLAIDMFGVLYEELIAGGEMSLANNPTRWIACAVCLPLLISKISKHCEAP